MIQFTQGNLLNADVDAVVNTVNTVGIMGKGIALMFKERFPDNFNAYAAACKRKEVQVGQMFVTAATELNGPRWIVNFPTKQHWRGNTKLEWVQSGLIDLKRIIVEKQIRSIAIPPLGCGNGGLEWDIVKPTIQNALSDLNEVKIIVFEPTFRYQNVVKPAGTVKLSPARALIADAVRRYSVLGLECSILEIQKLAWFLERLIDQLGLNNPLKLHFEANRYGPYADRLRHLLNELDGSYLHCDKRLADAKPMDIIRFDDDKHTMVDEYLAQERVRPFRDAIEKADELIDGFQSPLGMEALATVDWLLCRAAAKPTLAGIREALNNWPGDPSAAERKQRLFSDKLLNAALDRLQCCFGNNASQCE